MLVYKTFQSNLTNDNKMLVSEVYKATTFDKVEKRLSDCCKNVILYLCDGCGNEKKIPMTCQVRYCKKENCVKTRYNIALKRLFSLKIYVDRLMHFIIGFPLVDFYNKKIKLQFERKLMKFKKECANHGIELKGFRVFDITPHQDGKLYIHYHFAVIPYKKLTDVYLMHNLLESAMKNTNAIYKNCGYRTKKALFKYLAQRMAGIYGHNENTRYLADFLSLNEFVEHFYRYRALVVLAIPSPLSCNEVFNSILRKGQICDKCGSLMRFVDVIPDYEQYNIVELNT